MIKEFIGKFLSKRFYVLGYTIGKHPGLFLGATILFATLQSLGWLNFYHLQDFNYLYFMRHGRTESDRMFISETFPRNSSHTFDFSRLIEMSTAAVVIIKPKDDKSILREELVPEILHLEEFIRNMEVEWNGQSWNFSSLCAAWWFGDCIQNSAMEILLRIKEFQSGRLRPTYPIDWNSFKTGVAITALNLGGVEVDDENRILSAKAMRFVFQLDFRNESRQNLNKAWESKFLKEIGTLDFKKIDLSLFTSLSIADELTKTTLQVLPLCAVAGLFIIAFAVFTCLSSDWVISKPWLGIAGGLSSVLGVATAFGFAMMCGLPYIDVTLSIPFLMFGIGIDDAFVLIAAWRRTNMKNSVERRMAESYSEAAVSVTITSLTNFLSFCVGLATPFRITQIYCAYALIAIWFGYLYEITFFGACMALSGYREKKELHPFTLQPVLTDSETANRNFLYRICCSRNNRNNQKSELSVWPMIFFRDHFSKILINKYSRIAVMVIFFLYLGLSGWGCSQIREGVDYKIVFRYNSYGWKYMNWHYKYFTDYAQRVQLIINKPLDYSDPMVQRKVENILQTFENATYSEGPIMSESWLRTFKTYANSAVGYFSFRGYDLSKRQDFYDALNIFFRMPFFQKLSTDVIFDTNGTSILCSRFIFQTRKVHDSIAEKKMMKELYKLVDNSEYPVRVYNVLFPIFEQHLVVTDITIQTVASAVAIMTVVFFIFVPNFKCALSVAICLISIEIGVIAFMTFWNVKMDALSLLCLIMCVGFSVDFSSHVSYAYVACKIDKSDERIKHALYSAGMPVIQGALSTIIGVFFLIFAQSYSFVIFFKIVFIVMILAALHALTILPVIFSIADNLCKKSNPESIPQHNVDEMEKLNDVRLIQDRLTNNNIDVNKVPAPKC